MPHPNRSQGSALLSALFIVTLVAIVATAMNARIQLDIYRTTLTTSNNQLYLASHAIRFWAMDYLNMKEKKPPLLNGAADGLVARAPKSLSHLSPQLSMKGKLYDLQARFNLNNLQDKKYHPVFLNLLKNTLPDLPAKKRQLLLDAMCHWISPVLSDPQGKAQQATRYYLSQNPAYLPGNQLLQNVSEFRLIQGVSTKIYRTLLPYITALPEKTPINIRTASPVLLKSLANLTEDQLNQILEFRAQEGTTTQQLNQLIQKTNLPHRLLTTQSQFFLSVATVTSADASFTNYTVLKHTTHPQNKQNKTGIISESMNTY